LTDDNNDAKEAGTIPTKNEESEFAAEENSGSASDEEEISQDQQD
jgi:hypothetical protein